MKKIAIASGVAFAIAAALLTSTIVKADSNSTVSWPGWYLLANGRPLHRATVVAAAGTPKDNVSASGGASVAYTFTGGEYVCLQGDVAFYFEVIAAASMTASGALAERVEANARRCFFLRPGETKIAIDAVAGTATVKMFESRL